MPRVSVVLPTYNRLDRLKRVVAGLERQTYPLSQVEVVVISDGSTDGTNDYLTTMETPLQIVPLVQVNQGVAAARNRGIERARGEIVLFLDDDVVPAPLLIAEHVRVHDAEPDDVVVVGPMLNPPDFLMQPWVRWEQARLAEQYHAMITGQWDATPRQFYTGNASLKREQLMAVGGFDENFRRAEDVELAYRLAERGMRFVFNPEAVGFHYAERGFRSWIETPYAYGRNDVIFAHEKNQGWLFRVIGREFRGRNILIRLLIHMCLGQDVRTKILLTMLQTMSYLASYLRIEYLLDMMYSGIFNLRYYQGVADELGGRERFFGKIITPHIAE